MPWLQKSVNRYWRKFLTMQKLLTILILSLGLFYCRGINSNNGSKTLRFQHFTIETPEGWKKIEEQEADGYVGRIAIDERDTLKFDLSWFSNDLKEFVSVELTDGSLIYSPTDIYTSHAQTILTDSLVVIIDTSSEIYTDISKVEKSSVTYQLVDGEKAKILTPKMPGSGITGIYIDSLWKVGDEVDSFNLYGINLKPENQDLVMKSLQTLKFYK